ncbi:glycosyltransferase [Mucilaginibacter sp. PAMB04168]|uniref:glycosyltransferase n=1 Tax=Mucilaginibacter sp. PAMB04168 TaxID=3138567 RepID=UPI0031F6E9C0
MISVIISSVVPHMLASVSENIAATIGVPYELIGIDNGTGARGICEIYNQGTRQAKYDILCFVHEDVAFKTAYWGQHVINTFATEPDLGLLGIAGSSYKNAAPSGWHGIGFFTDHVNILQGYKQTNAELKHYCRNPHNDQFTEVVSIDGVWFCTPRKVAQQIPFDQKTFTGFHAYDVDFSLAVRQHYKVKVTYDVLLHHFSEGTYDDKWVFEILKLHNKWYKHLPAQSAPIDPDDQFTAESKTFFLFISQAVAAKVPMRLVYQALWHCTVYRKKWPKFFFKLSKHIYRSYRAAR